MALQYPRLDVKLIAGAIASMPIDLSKTKLIGNDFVQDTYIQSLKPGTVVYMKAEGFITPVTDATQAAQVPLGILVNSADGYANQNVNAQSTGLIAVLVGSGNQFVTDNVEQADITVGAKLYANAQGQLSKTEKGSPVAVALSANSASNKAILAQQLI